MVHISLEQLYIRPAVIYIVFFYFSGFLPRSLLHASCFHKELVVGIRKAPVANMCESISSIIISALAKHTSVHFGI